MLTKIVLGVLALFVLVLFAHAAIGINARAGEPLKPGDAAPDVKLALDDGTALQLSSAKRPVVLYFYPKDDTPGCTREACTFRDRAEEVTRTGALVVGVSFDDAASHKKFRTKHKLAFALATDDGSVAAAFGVTVRNLAVAKFHARDTFVISADMKLLAVLRGVDPVESVEEVLKALGGEAKGGASAPTAPTVSAQPKKVS